MQTTNTRCRSRSVVAVRFSELRTRRRGRRAVRCRRLPIGRVYGRRFPNRRASATTTDGPPARRPF